MNRITHIGIHVSDLERSEKFYIDVLEGRKTGSISEGSTLISFIELPGGTIELIQKSEAAQIPHGKYMHVALETDDVEREFRRVSSLGAVLKNKELVEFSGGKLFFFYGPDGEELEYCSGLHIDGVE